MVGKVAAGNDPGEELHRIKLLVFRGFVVLLVAVLLLSVLWVSSLVYDVDWVVREVDEAAITCSPVLSEAPTGELLMAYGTSAGLTLATEDEGAWSISHVMASGLGENAFSVRAVDMAVDDAGGVHIASVSYWPEIGIFGLTRLVYSSQTSTGWENVVVDENVSTVGVSLAVDSDSNAHISYVTTDSGWSFVRNVTYATDSAGEWMYYDISSGLPCKWDMHVASSICVDSTGEPHIAFISEFIAGHVTNLTGTLTYAFVGWGNPALSGIYPSCPAILADADGVVHVVCYDERQDVMSDGQITRTLVHFRYSEGEGSYENATLASDADLSWDRTQAVIDPEGGLRLFYTSDYGIGVITLTRDGEVSEDSVPAITDSAWMDGVSVVVRADGETVISKRYSPIGYVTDSFTFSERLSTATDPVQQTLITLVVIAVLVSAAVVLSRRAFREESKWHEALKE